MPWPMNWRQPRSSPKQEPGIPPLVERVIDYYVGKLDDGAGDAY